MADGSNNLLRRYVHGPGVDEPLVWYEGAGVGAAKRRWFLANHQGSIITVANSAGTVTNWLSYDPYGIPNGIVDGKFNAFSRFQYTGQIVLPEVDLYHYKARVYSPTLGRFLQTDPIGYDDQVNLYAYAGNDPVNGRDPTGTSCEREGGDFCGYARDFLVGDIEDTIANPSVTSVAVAAVTTVLKPVKVLDKLVDAAPLLKKVANPFGSKGKPDHQRAVDLLERKAQQQAKPGERVVRERAAVGIDRRRIPDVQIRDSSGRTRKVFEAERNPNSARVQAKRDDDEKAGITCEVSDLKGRRC